MNKNKVSFTNTKNYITLSQNDFDPMRHVFVSDDKVYRGITSERKNIIEELFRKGIIDSLIREGVLTNSEIREIKHDEYVMMVEQNELLPPVLSFQLSPSLRRDVGILLLRLLELLGQHNMTLYGFEYSYVFLNEKGRPVFHNLDSIIYKDDQKFHFSEFFTKFLGPLRLLEKKPELANTLQYST